MTIENTLTNDEITNIVFMREEEKLARDVYNELYEQWGVNIFDNIATAEQNHMDSVKVILDAYDIADPAHTEQGSFEDPQLQELYNSLIEQGSSSLIDALSAGALIEEVDIQDLYQAIDTTTNPDLIEMYTNLLNGSYKHLNAFVEQLSSEGITYEPQILSDEVFNEILNNESENTDTHEQSNSHGQSNSQGQSDSHGQSDSQGKSDSHGQSGNNQEEFSLQDIENILKKEFGTEPSNEFNNGNQSKIDNKSILEISDYITNGFHHGAAETIAEQTFIYDDTILSGMQNDIQLIGVSNGEEQIHDCDIFS